MNLADILKLAGLAQQEPMNSLSSPGSSCNQHMNPEDMRTLVVKIEQPQLQPEQEMVATEEAEGSYANAPEEKEVGDTHNDFSFKGFGKRKRHTRDALSNYGDNPLEESNMFEMYKNFKLNEVNWRSTDDVEAEYKRLGLDQGDDPLGGWYDTMGMTDLQIRKAREKRIHQAYKNNALAKAQAATSAAEDDRVAGRGGAGEKEGRAVAVATANKAAELARQHAGEEEAIAAQNKISTPAVAGGPIDVEPGAVQTVVSQPKKVARAKTEIPADTGFTNHKSHGSKWTTGASHLPSPWDKKAQSGTNKASRQGYEWAKPKIKPLQKSTAVGQ